MQFFGQTTIRRASAVLLVMLGTVGTTGCEFITGVPSVGTVEMTLAPTAFPAGTSVQANAVAKKDNGTIITHRRRVPRYSTSDASVATVSADGAVFGVAPGTADIVAESDGKSAKVTVTVLPFFPTRIDLAPEFPQVPVNETLLVGVRAFQSTGAEITGFTLNCQVANTTIASVTIAANGCNVRGIAPGTTALLVTVNGIDRSVPLVVTPPRIARITADIRRPIRESEQVAVQVSLFGANNIPLQVAGRGLAFTTSDATVATVNSQTGVVTAQREGTAIITAVTEGDLRDTALVQVTKVPVQTVVLGPDNAQFRIGLNGAVSMVALDSVNNRLSVVGRNMSFTSLDTAVLKVLPSGIVTTGRIGTTRIIGQVDGVADTINARVTEIPTARVVIDTNLVQRFPGETFQYTATVFDSLNNVVTGRQVRWTSSSPVVQINSATGLARAIGAGTSTIRLEVTRVSGLPEVVIDDASFQVLQAPVARLEVAPTTISLKVNETRIINVTAFDANGAPLFGRTIIPTVNPAGVATSSNVQSDGTATIRALTAGTTTITYRAFNQFNQPEGTTAQITVTVTP